MAAKRTLDTPAEPRKREPLVLARVCKLMESDMDAAIELATQHSILAGKEYTNECGMQIDAHDAIIRRWLDGDKGIDSLQKWEAAGLLISDACDAYLIDTICSDDSTWSTEVVRHIIRHYKGTTNLLTQIVNKASARILALAYERCQCLDYINFYDFMWAFPKHWDKYPIFVAGTDITKALLPSILRAAVNREINIFNYARGRNFYSSLAPMITHAISNGTPIETIVELILKTNDTKLIKTLTQILAHDPTLISNKLVNLLYHPKFDDARMVLEIRKLVAPIIGLDASWKIRGMVDIPRVAPSTRDSVPPKAVATPRAPVPKSEAASSSAAASSSSASRGTIQSLASSEPADI